MSQAPNVSNKLTPEYWGGQDIFNSDLFREAPYIPHPYLEFKKFKYARSCLQYGVGQVAAGNSTEIRYRAGNEFNPDLEDGSLVVIDSEHLSRWTYDDPERSWEGFRPWDEGPAITRPYSDFWLKNQDGTPYPINLGSETITFVDELSIYSRSLSWGIIAEQDKTRLIQPFLFGATKLMSNGHINTPRALKRDSGLHGYAIRMPINVGEVDVWPRLSLGTCAIDALDRIRSVDVVYPAAGSKEPKTSKRRGLGKLSLKLGMSSV